MTDRDELIRLAKRDLAINCAVWPDRDGEDVIGFEDAAEALVDAGWTPPPSADVVEAAALIIGKGAGWQIATEQNGRAAQRLADAGLLRTVQQDAEDAEKRRAIAARARGDYATERAALDTLALLERGRQLANQRDNLIAAGADPTELAVPLSPQQDAERCACGEPLRPCGDMRCYSCDPEVPDNAAIVGTHVVDILADGTLGLDCVACGQRAIPHPGPCPGVWRP